VLDSVEEVIPEIIVQFEKIEQYLQNKMND
jgi:hypothetical protein